MLGAKNLKTVQYIPQKITPTRQGNNVVINSSLLPRGWFPRPSRPLHPRSPPHRFPTSTLPPHHNLWKNSFKIIFERKNFQAKALNRTFQRFIAILSAATLKAICHQALSKKKTPSHTAMPDESKELSLSTCSNDFQHNHALDSMPYNPSGPWLTASCEHMPQASSLCHSPHANSSMSSEISLKNIFFSQRMKTACEKGSRHSLHVGPNPSTSHNSIWPGCKFSGQSHLPGRPHNEQLNNVCLQ